MPDSIRINPADFLPPNPTVDDAVTLARRWQGESNLEAAYKLYEQILAGIPDHVDALNFGGVLSYQLGHIKEGLYRLLRCLELAPNYHDAHANLGLMLYNINDLPGSERHLTRAIELDPAQFPPRINLAMLRRKQGRVEEAIEMLKALMKEDPRHPLVQHALYSVLKSFGRMQEAHEHLRMAHEHSDMGNLGARIAMAFAREGRLAEALEQVKSLIELNPNVAELHHLLAAFGGAPAPERASDAMVSEVFDSFAPKFDEKLAFLEYKAPELVAAALRRRLEPSAPKVDLLDAGCGTGLLAAHVRPLAHTLRGVDLSAGMLERARKLELYDELVQAELTAYLLAHPGQFDVVTCVDTLCYFGAIDRACEAAFKSLRAGGWLLFSVEDGSDQTGDHQLCLSGRYVHNKDYVERALRHAGFATTSIEHEVLRSEMREPVQGLICAARRNA